MKGLIYPSDCNDLDPRTGTVDWTDSTFYPMLTFTLLQLRDLLQRFMHNLPSMHQLSSRTTGVPST